MVPIPLEFSHLIPLVITTTTTMLLSDMSNVFDNCRWEYQEVLWHFWFQEMFVMVEYPIKDAKACHV